jgi:hypothetical protein
MKKKPQHYVVDLNNVMLKDLIVVMGAAGMEPRISLVQRKSPKKIRAKSKEVKS